MILNVSIEAKLMSRTEDKWKCILWIQLIRLNSKMFLAGMKKHNGFIKD